MCKKYALTGWPRPIGCLKLQVVFRKRATEYWAQLQKMTYKHEASYDSMPPCMRDLGIREIFIHEREEHIYERDEHMSTATHCNPLEYLPNFAGLKRTVNTLQHTATHCNTLQHTATHCNTPAQCRSCEAHCQHTATLPNTLQHTATHCNTPVQFCPFEAHSPHCNTLQHTATHGITRHHTATHRHACSISPFESTRLHTATHCNTRQHPATHCTTLHHTAPHCNTLHHTTTHCNTLQHTGTPAQFRPSEAHSLHPTF